MKIKILKGTNTIGGAFTEIQTDKTRILIDFGDDLDDPEPKRLPEIEGLTKGKPIYDAVIISHRTSRPLPEEYGEILPEIPVYFADISRNILETVFTFTSKGNITHDTINILDQVPIKIRNITVIPYIVDHSAYNSFMFLILAENKRILYTGDYRNHRL